MRMKKNKKKYEFVIDLQRAANEFDKNGLTKAADHIDQAIKIFSAKIRTGYNPKKLKEEYLRLSNKLQQMEEELHEMGEKTPEDDFQNNWRRERAMEEGMLHGTDAYNEMMGQEVTTREDFENDLSPDDPYWDGPEDDD